MVNSYNNNGDGRLALEELAQVEPTTQELIQERLQLKQKINNYCPILNFPPEISMQFFRTTFPENSSSWGKATPLLLGAVCHAWRELAWSYPRLWSSVSLIVSHYSDTKNDLLQEWLARSRNLPLSIKLGMGQPEDMDGAWRNTIDIIARCSERWKTIEFSPFIMFHPEICSMPTHLPLLESISIYQMPRVYLKYGMYAFRRTTPRMICNAPKLQSIYISPTVTPYPHFHLNLKQKTRFSQKGPPISITRCLEILKDAPDLVECQFGGVEKGAPTVSVTALQLETLEVGFRCTNDEDTLCMSGFLENLTTPALRQLSISQSQPPNQSEFDDTDWHAQFPFWALISFISRSACHIVRLSLSGIILLPNELAACLSATPLLTELQLEEMTITNETFEVLSVDEVSQKILLPNLETFIYVYYGYLEYTLDFAGLLTMARSRRHFSPLISASLQHICIDYPRTIKDIYLDSHDDVPQGSNGADGQNDGAVEGESTKLNRRVMAEFRGLIAEGMDIRILGPQKTDLLKSDVDSL